MNLVINDLFLIRWIKKLLEKQRVRKQRKRIAYLDKQWDKKLRGLR